MDLSPGWKIILRLTGLCCLVASLYLFFSVTVSADLRSSEESGEVFLFFRQPDRNFNEWNKCRFHAAFPKNGEPVRIRFSFHSLRPVVQYRLDPGERPGAWYRLDALSIRLYGGLLECRADNPENAARIEVNDQLVQDREKLPGISAVASGPDPQILIPAAALSRRLSLSAGSLCCPGLFLLGSALLLAPGFLAGRGKRQEDAAGHPA